MDSRIRDDQIAKLSRKIVFICLGSIGSNTQYIEAVHTALVRHRVLLTAEPDTCEDAQDASDSIRSYILSAEYENDHGIGCLECWNSKYKQRVSEIISQVSDKRTEELREENERLKARILELTKPYYPKYPEPKVYEYRGPAPQVWFRDVNKPDITEPKQ